MIRGRFSVFMWGSYFLGKAIIIHVIAVCYVNTYIQMLLFQNTKEFINIDNSIADDDLIKRYIYVGVSRAAFFLGITLNANNESITKYFKQSDDWGKVR